VAAFGVFGLIRQYQCPSDCRETGLDDLHGPDSNLLHETAATWSHLRFGSSSAGEII